MATYDGSGDIAYTTDELMKIVKVLKKAIKQSSPGDLHSISAGIMKEGVVVNVRPPRHRGPIETLACDVLPYGVSNL